MIVSDHLWQMLDPSLVRIVVVHAHEQVASSVDRAFPNAAQAVDFVNKRLDAGMAAGAICVELLDSCLAKNPKEARGIGCDNMTASVIVFKQ